MGLKLGTQLGKIVDLAVEYHGDRTILRLHRLGTAGKVDDRQPAMAQRHARRAIKAAAIGPAMDQRVGHGRDQPLGKGPPSPAIEQARYAAHGNTPLW